MTLSEPLDPKVLLSLGRQKAGWSKHGVQTGLRVSWKRLGPSKLPNFKLHRFGIRQELGNRQPSAYAVIATNPDCEGRDLVAGFLEGAAELSRMVGDLDSLAWGANPGNRNRKTAEAQFHLAMLTFNLCSVIRQTCLKPANVSIDRFRELVIHCAGTISTSGRYRRLQLCQPDSKERFEQVQRTFRLAEKPAAVA